MSSHSLSSSDMNMIEQLLAEVRDPEHRSFDKETTQARMLVHAMESGIRSTSDLRSRLADHVALHSTIDSSHEQWENEGGAHLAPIRHGQYGMRIESDGTWTIYEVFNGREARQRGLAPSGLTREEAVDRLMRFSAGGIGASDDELQADRRSSFSFWRKDV